MWHWCCSKELSPSAGTTHLSNDVLTRCNRCIIDVSVKVWAGHFSTYIYQKRGFYYFSRRVPKDVQPLHGKQRIVLALNTCSRAKALKYSQVMCQRLDERWLHANFRNDIVIHGIRHAMRDRLSAVSCPSEMIDQIGGWSKRSVGEGYGEGCSVLQRKQWMTRLLTKQN